MSVAGTGAEYVRFPPRWRNVLVPVAPPRATALGVTLYSASRPLPWAAQQVLWALARVAGARLLPGDRESWTNPLDPGVADELHRQWRALAGEADAVAVYERTQAARAALTLLWCAGRRSLLLRVRRDPASLVRERLVSEAAQRLRTTAVRVPRLVGAGETAGWHWTAFETMGRRPHRPLYRLPPGAVDEIAELVGGIVPQPPGLASGWRPGHLDISPWNLRRSAGRTWLIDWEDAGWAPAHADEVYLAAVAAALRGGRVRRPAIVEAYPEAAGYWSTIVTSRVINANETPLRDRTLEALSPTGASLRGA